MTVLRDDLLGQQAEAPTPQTYPELRSALLARYDGLPAQLKIVAQYLIDKPNDAALMTIAALSEATGVQPSAFIRFSKAEGFKGYLNIFLKMFRQHYPYSAAAALVVSVFFIYLLVSFIRCLCDDDEEEYYVDEKSKED